MSVGTSPRYQAAPARPARSVWAVAADLLDPPRDDDHDLAERLSRDLRLLIREAWPIVEPATPMVHAWHIDVIAEHLEAVTAGELTRLIVNVPPRTMKSLSVGVFWPAWEWLTGAHVRWLCASYAGALSTRDSVKMRRLIESRGGRETGTIFQRLGYQGVLRLLTPTGEPWQLTGDQNAKTRYDTTDAGFRIATSVGAMATGEGGDRIVVDDPINAEQARSDAERVAANVWWDETMTTRFNNAQAAAVIVMQRLHEQDLTGHLLEKGGWHHLCLPAEYEPKHPFVYPAKVILLERTYTVQAENGDPETVLIPGGRELAGDPRTMPGELLEPVRLGPERLTELARDLGSYSYAGQMQQRPSPAEGGMFKRHWWRRYTLQDLDQLHLGFERKVASWDMRFTDSEAKTTSYVVGQVWGVHGPNRYLLAQVRARLGFSDTCKAVKALEEFIPDAVAKLVERKANGAAVIETLQTEIPGLIPIDPEGGKEVRAAAAEPYVEAGNVFLPAGEFIPCPQSIPGGKGKPPVELEPTSVAAFVEEHAVFPNGTNDDQVDAMTQALNWLRTGSAGVVTDDEHPAPEHADVHEDLRPRDDVDFLTASF